MIDKIKKISQNFPKNSCFQSLFFFIIEEKKEDTEMSVQEIIDLLYMMAGEEIIGLREKTEDGFILRLSEDMQFEITVKAA